MRSQTNCKALVVDDNLISRTIVEELLFDLEIACISADSAKKALKILETNEPDIIFVDHVMPDIDGVELCRRIRALGGGFKEIPVIVLTGNEIDEYRELYANAGFSGWLTKPVDAKELERLLPIKRTITPKGISAGVVNTFVKYTREVIPKMDKYLTSNELQLYAIEAHSLKSNIKSLGSDELSALARELEQLADKSDINGLKEKHPMFAQRTLEFIDSIEVSDAPAEIDVQHVKGKRIVLAIDDNPVNLHLISDTLSKDYNIFTEISGKRAMEFLSKTIPDLILLDIRMPQMSGYDIIEIMKNDPLLQDIPVIFLTGSEEIKDEAHAFEVGAVDFIKKPIQPSIVLARVKLHLELELYRKNLEKMVQERTTKLEHIEDVILSLLANVASYRDEETGTHIQRTTDYVNLLVKLLQEANPPGYYISKSYGDFIVKSAKLHDIGKVAIPDGILLKPGKLTPEEFDMMKNHTLDGAHMIDDAIRDLQDDSFLRVAREIVIGHHEKWNGMGYPYKIKGEEIPLSARIMAIADVYDALISERPYKVPFTHEKAIEIILGDSGTHFDPVILDVARSHLDEFDAIAKKHKE